MQFRVGPWVYRVIVSQKPILGRDGHPLAGRVDAGARRIILAAGLDPQHQVETLYHELRHAWSFHFPTPRTDEEVCDLSAAIMEQIRQDLEAQGGIEAFGAMFDPPETSPTQPEATAPRGQASGRVRHVPVTEDYIVRARPPGELIGRQAECTVCGRLVAPGAIVTEKPTWEPRWHTQACRRTLYCAHCDHLQTWHEAWRDGRPGGEAIATPQHIRGSAVYVFLHQHPEATGVVAA
jgi:hypothetical protein